jgi:predicted ribosomally synthesized peptide with SipW-like signal peptide
LSAHLAAHSAALPQFALRRISRGGRIRAVLALGTVLGLGTVLTLATWTDSGEAAGTFSTGSVDITLDGVNTLPSIASLALTNAKPGDVTYAPLAVTNAGTLDFDYVIAPSITTASSSTPLLESVLLVTVKAVPGTTCDATTFGASSDTRIAERALDVTTATDPTTLVSGTGVDHLCFKVELPSSASSAVMTQTTTATFTFTATQS